MHIFQAHALNLLNDQSKKKTRCPTVIEAQTSQLEQLSELTVVKT
jgi:hypothetical protein